MFHHPYNWMPADAARVFRKRIEAIADIVFTGHEHDSTMRSQQVSTGEKNLYIEGGALQESHDAARSTFNCLIIDIANRKQKLARFEWDGSAYLNPGHNRDSGDAFGLEWEEFQVTRLKQRGEFELSDQMRQLLEDPGATIIHKTRGALRLSDVFVYPDLREADYRFEEVGRIIRDDAVRDLLVESTRTVIVGESEYGKSILCKRACADLLDAGYIPVIVDGSVRPPTGDRLHSYIARLFEEQYQPEDLESYLRLDVSRRAILVDDFHRLPVGTEQRHAFLKEISEFAGKVIIFSDDFAQEVRDLFNPGSRPDAVAAFDTYRILPFGHVKRNQLVEKWLLLDDTATADLSRYAYRREELTRVLDNLAGRNFLPPHPIYILSVLMGADALTPLDPRISSYGAYYELFIRASLARGRTPVQSGFVLRAPNKTVVWP
jgi:hypothetical protein